MTSATSNLATRCPSCGTVFRVVPDQLRVSSGWVRCGRCSGVFDATDALFDTEHGMPVPRLEPMAADGNLQPYPPSQPPQSPQPPHPPLPAVDAAIPATLAPERAGPVAAATHPDIFADPPRHAAAPALRQQIDAPTDDTPAGLLRAPSRIADRPDPVDDDIVIIDHVALPAIVADAEPLDAGADPDDAPAFVRDANRAERWRRPAVRAASAGVAVLLAVLLAAQAALLWRDTLAAHLPAIAALLATLCRGAGCVVEPLRRIERLSLESSNLARLDAPANVAADGAASGEPRYRLDLLLRNRADVALMLPAIDLSLTDARGQLVARRVLRMAELGAPRTVIDAGRELPLQALLGTGELRVEGYTVELFYP